MNISDPILQSTIQNKCRVRPFEEYKGRVNDSIRPVFDRFASSMNSCTGINLLYPAEHKKDFESLLNIHFLLLKEVDKDLSEAEWDEIASRFSIEDKRSILDRGPYIYIEYRDGLPFPSGTCYY